VSRTSRNASCFSSSWAFCLYSAGRDVTSRGALEQLPYRFLQKNFLTIITACTALQN